MEPTPLTEAWRAAVWGHPLVDLNRRTLDIIAAEILPTADARQAARVQIYIAIAANQNMPPVYSTDGLEQAAEQLSDARDQAVSAWIELMADGDPIQAYAEVQGAEWLQAFAEAGMITSAEALAWLTRHHMPIG